MIRIVFAIMLMLFSVQAAHAVLPSEMLTNPVQEARARSISSNLRCLVCQNQTIDDSSADLARDLRLIVRERIVAGDSDAQVMDYVVARYGNYVLLKPPFQMDTALLWLLPFAALILALAVAYTTLRGRLVPDDADEPNDILKGD
ncbi:MAG TPA: cytochrome c-type biogenesis protein [Aestuariivirga sp.]